MTPINPYFVGGKIPARYFCDRKEESARLIREITNGNNLVLVSPRRMGKTGLIQHCFDEPQISKNFETFYLDILQTSSLKEFTYLLGREIFNRLASYGDRTLRQFASMLRSIAGSFGFDALSGMPTFNLHMGDISNPVLTLEEIFNYLRDSKTPTIIAIDEFQQISTYKEKNVEAILRSNIQQLPSTNFIFAGSERHMLQQMFSDSARPFYGSASFLELNAIREETYSGFAIELFNERNRTISENEVKNVYDTFSGNTFYMQKALNIAFSLTPEGDYCGQETIHYALNEMIASYDTIYREMLSPLNESQKQLLLAIAQENRCEGITSADFIKSHALKSASAVQAAATRLMSTGLLIRKANVYSLQDPLLRIWLLRNYGAK
ncbi:MAG: ATPase [Duncaniella sp.]|nr:ATPase [Duncaniella sp.]